MSLFVLDTDHVSLLRKGHATVIQRLSDFQAEQIAITIVTVEELLTGWYTQLRQARDAERMARAYAGLDQTLEFVKKIVVLPFSTPAVNRYLALRQQFPRRGKQDLKIAAIVLEHFGVLVTRNRADFESIEKLELEDWSVAHLPD